MNSEFYVSIVKLEYFMNDHFFISLVRDWEAETEVKYTRCLYQFNSPFCVYLFFKNLEKKREFIEKFNGRIFPGLTKQIIIEQNPAPLMSIKLQSELPEEKLVYYSCDYQLLCELYYEKNYTDEGLVFTDTVLLEKQRNSITYLIKKVGSNIMKGKSIMNISLPVFMFDERTLLQTFIYENSLAPFFLNRAYYADSSLERLKWVTVFTFASLNLSAIQSKPFTPILGETSHLKVGDLDIYLENVISKPPTLSFYGVAPNYKMYGTIMLYAETGANSITAKKTGNFTVEFDNLGQKDLYHIHIPPIFVNGALFGKRTFNYFGSLIVSSITLGKSSVIKFNPEKRGTISSFFGFSQKTFPDYAKGYIIKSDLVKIDKTNLDHVCNPNENDIEVAIEGEWTTNLKFNKLEYWSKEEYRVPKIQLPTWILPSDSLKRKDVEYFKSKNEDEAQKWKEDYEQTQRNDRNLRKLILPTN